MTGLPEVMHFRDVPVAPSSRVMNAMADGGPVWPDFEAQHGARFCRDGIPCDARPPVADHAVRIDRPAVWGGFLIRQFGHLVGEQLTRLPQARRDRPDDLYLFTVEPGETRASLPDHVWQALAWHGLPPEQVHLVDQDCLAGDLRVAIQGEMLGAQPAPDAYLELLEENAARNALAPQPAGVVYVTRAGMVARGQGGHAGEAYLARMLTHCGVPVIDPGALPLRTQLAAYAGARTLIFAEGSALHGRCMLGRLTQDIHVLRRRPHRDTARTQLARRCAGLHYHATVARRLAGGRPGGPRRYDRDVAILDLDAVFALSGGLGIPLARHWNARHYAEAVEADLWAWLAVNGPTPERVAAIDRVVSRLGWTIPSTPSRRAPGHAKPRP
jgi:hypothetical protein